MKKMFLSFIILISVTNSFGQNIIEQAPQWKGAKPLPYVQTRYLTATGVIFKAPQFNRDSTVSPSSIEVYVMMEDGTVGTVSLDRIEPSPQTGSIENINWKAIFNRPAVLGGDGQRYYQTPLKLTVHVYPYGGSTTNYLVL